MSLKTTVITNTLVQFFGRFASSILGFITTIILARSLGVEDYGSYAKIYALATFFYLLVDFGLNAIYIRKERDDTTRIHTLTSIRTLLFLLCCTIVIVFFAVSGQRIFNLQEQLLTGIALMTVLLFGYITSCNMVFQLTHRYDRSVLASMVGGSIGVGLLLLLPHTVGYAVSSIAAGYAITTVLCYRFAHQLNHTLSFFPSITVARSSSYQQQLRTLFIASLPVGLMLFLNTMYSHVDIFIISAYQGNDAVALYQLAYKFFEFPLAFATFFANAIFPHYVALYQDNRSRFYQLFHKGMMGLFAVSVLFTALMWVIAPYIGLIRPEYTASIVPLQILSLSYPIFFLTSPLSWLLFLRRREWALVIIYGASFVVNVVANLIYVPMYGYIASSWITLLGELGVLAALASCAYLWHTRAS